MKISVDGVDVLEIQDWQLTCLSYVMNIDDAKRKIVTDLSRSVLSSVAQAYDLMVINEWVPVLRDRYESLPTKDDALISLITSQPDYKDFDARQVDSETQSM